MANKLDKLLHQAHKFRGWLGLPEAGLFNDFLDDYRNEILGKLVKESDSVRIYRLQGSLEVLDSIIQLRGEVDTYIKGLATGQMRKIETEKEIQNGLGQRKN